MISTETPDLVMQAAFGGTLTVTDRGCWAVDGGDWTYPVEFPLGSRLSEDGGTVTVPDLGALAPGDRVEGGGGYLVLEDVPEECSPDGVPVESIIWQSHADGSVP